jgi:hypothetical protein
MKRIAFLIALLTLVVGVTTADAQRRGGSSSGNLAWTDIPDHKIELNGFYGYMWTWGRSYYYGVNSGSVDIKSTGYYGGSLDVVLRPDAQLTLMFSHQPSDLQVKGGTFGGTSTIGSMDVQYYQIGGLYGVPRGKAWPFTMFTLGATRYNLKEINTEEFPDLVPGDEWRFSIIFGLGAKYYASERIGLRVQGTLPLTFFSGGFGFGCGGGGCGGTVGGTGLAQTGVSGGLFLNL